MYASKDFMFLLSFTLNLNLPGIDIYALFLKESTSSSSKALGRRCYTTSSSHLPSPTAPTWA